MSTLQSDAAVLALLLTLLWAWLLPGGNAPLKTVLASLPSEACQEVTVVDVHHTSDTQLPLWRRYHPAVWPRRAGERLRSDRSVGGGATGFPLHQHVITVERCGEQVTLEAIEEAWSPPGFMVFCSTDVHYGIAQLTITAGGLQARDLAAHLRQRFPDLIVRVE